MATTKTAPKQTTTTVATNETEIKGDLCLFDMSALAKDPIPVRRWITVHMKYGVLRELLTVEAYNPEQNTGEQRRRVDSHVNLLKREELAGQYTPSPWSASVLDMHLPDLEINESRGKVTLKVSPTKRLRLIDGGHRKESLEDLRKENAVDTTKLAAIDNLDISLTIYLDPHFMRADFLHLQEGLRVNRSQTKFMSEVEGNVKPELVPYVDLARKVAVGLNKDPKSPLYQNIKMASHDTAKVEYASITTRSGSDIGTSIFGGAKIVLYPEFSRLFADPDAARKFLLDCQIAAYQAMYQYDQIVSYTDPIDGQVVEYPNLLGDNKILRPSILKGKKMANALLIMMGNMLAYRLLSQGRTECKPDDLRRLVEATQATLDLPASEGSSTTDKRRITGRFVREYFSDLVMSGEGTADDTGKLIAVDDVPYVLCESILTRSTLDVGSNAVPLIPAELASQITTTDANPNAPRKRGRPKKAVLPASVTSIQHTTAPTNETTEEMADGFIPPPPANAKPTTLKGNLEVMA